MSLRDKNGAAEDPPFKPQPVKPPSDADIKKYKEILEKRKSGRDNRRSKKPAGGAAPHAPAGAAASPPSSLQVEAVRLLLHAVGPAGAAPPGDITTAVAHAFKTPRPEVSTLAAIVSAAYAALHPYVKLRDIPLRFQGRKRNLAAWRTRIHAAVAVVLSRPGDAYALLPPAAPAPPPAGRAGARRGTPGGRARGALALLTLGLAQPVQPAAAGPVVSGLALATSPCVPNHARSGGGVHPLFAALVLGATPTSSWLAAPPPAFAARRRGRDRGFRSRCGCGIVAG